MTKPKKHKHIDCLVKLASLQTHEGVEVEVFDLNFKNLKDRALKNWAKHFREHYCLDSKIDLLLGNTPHKTRKEYLLNLAFPNLKGFGPATRSGDFTEILISDFIESIFQFWVPRTRYRIKQIPNESPKGSDIVGLKFKFNSQRHSPEDRLMTFEVKALMAFDKDSNRLQDAVDDARKDSRHDLLVGDGQGEFRVGLTLNALKARYIDVDDKKGWKAVERFQDPIARPYHHQIGAAAVLCTSAYDEKVAREVKTTAYPSNSRPMLIIVKGEAMMKFIHAMYERAADEA